MGREICQYQVGGSCLQIDMFNETIYIEQTRQELDEIVEVT